MISETPEQFLSRRVGEEQERAEGAEAERDQWKRAANGDRDGVIAHASHMHTVTALVDERKAIQAQHDALYLAVQGEVEHLQEVREKARDADDFEDGVADVHRRLQAILDSAGEKREVSDYGKVAAEVKALLRVLDFASIDDVDIPEDWASVTCENPGHRERQEDASWVCPDCLSGWWAVVDEAQPPAYHVRAFLRRLVAHLSSEQKGAD